MDKKLISITAPAFNEAETLDLLVESIAKVFSGLPQYNYEIVIAENGSTDDSLKVLRRLSKENSHVRYISLSRNFGHQGGILAGLSHCRGDVIISMDADLQHPPEEIPTMLKAWEEGAEIVEMRKNEKASGFIRGSINSVFYNLVDFISGYRLERGDFRLLSKHVLDELLNLPEREKYLRGLVPWMGFRKVILPFEIQARKHGKSKFSIKQLANFAFNGITSFSVLPLRLGMHFGFLLLIPSTLLLIYFLVLGTQYYFLGQDSLLPPGWATQTVVITFFGSVQLLFIGILGEYVGRIFIETKGRPNFIVKEKGND